MAEVTQTSAMGRFVRRAWAMSTRMLDGQEYQPNRPRSPGVAFVRRTSNICLQKSLKCRRLDEVRTIKYLAQASIGRFSRDSDHDLPASSSRTAV